MESLIKRDIFDDLKNHLSQKEITLLIGPRQAGKTTLLLLLQGYLKRNAQKTLFLNLDIEADKQYFVSQATLIKKIQLEFGKERGYVFLDEIQRKENAGLFLKGIYDMDLPYKFIISGSGSVELKEKIHESLVGRKRVFMLSTISFREFVNFKTHYKYEHKLIDFFSLEKEKTSGFLEEYLNFGGYPRVLLAENFDEKKKIIGEIYQSYIEKDISYLLKIEKIDAFSHLVKILASQIGQITHMSELAGTLGISLKTIKNYLWYLEKTFVIEKITPYFKNVRKEIIKSPLYYFLDLGLRNYALGNFGSIQKISIDIGFLFQNFIFLLLKEKTIAEATDIHFWRTKDGAEVDFILEKGNMVSPIEVKYGELKKEKIMRSLRTFIEKYPVKEAHIIHLGTEKKSNHNKIPVHFLPFYRIVSPGFSFHLI